MSAVDAVVLPVLSSQDAMHFGAISTKRLNELRAEAILADRERRINRAALLRAAYILEREAATLADSYSIDDAAHGVTDWTDEDARRDHDEMRAIAAELRRETA